MMPRRLVLATTNPGKIPELSALVREWGDIEIVLLASFPHVELPVETGATYLDNAAVKARAVAAATGLPALADDSGIEVDALAGAPGIRSARYATSDEARIDKLLDALRDVPEEARTARYQCVAVLAWPDGRMESGDGTCCGRIAAHPCGEEGFGYDPIFIADELGRTCASVSAAEKDRVSHRARAMRALGERLCER